MMKTTERSHDDPQMEAIDTCMPSIEISMLTEEREKVVNLLGRFAVSREDDTAQDAATRLASMALVLANIASGHLRVIADGFEFDPAVDFIVEGGMASVDFNNTVIGPLSWIQDRCERNTLHDVTPHYRGHPQNQNLITDKMKADDCDAVALPIPRIKRIFTEGQRKYIEVQRAMRLAPGSQVLAKTHSDTDAVQNPSMCLYYHLVGEALSTFRHETLLREAVEYPLFFSKTSVTGGMFGHSSRAHLGRQIIHAEIDSLMTLEQMRKALTQAGGRYASAASQGSPAVRFNLALSATTGLLDEAVATAGHQQRIMPELLWLVESAPGCELPHPEAWPTHHAPLNFRNACQNEIRNRISFSENDIHSLGALDGHLSEWRQFVREQERHLPGIARAVHHLPVALCYGLESLSGHNKAMNGGEVMALAKWLVLRMSNRIGVAVAHGQDTRVERLAKKLAEKLILKGPMSVRELSRRCSKLSANDCRAALKWLEARGIVGEDEGTWGILGEVGESFAPAWSDRKAG